MKAKFLPQGTKCLVFVVTLLTVLVMSVRVEAQVYAIADGFWSDGTTWSTGTPPTSTDDVIIGDFVTVFVGSDESCASVTLGFNTSDGYLYLLTNKILTISGTLMVGGVGDYEVGTLGLNGGAQVNAGFVQIGGSGNYSNGSFSMGTGSILNTGNLQIGGTGDYSYASLTLGPTTTVNLSGNLQIGGAATALQANGSLLINNGAVITIPGTFAVGTTSVNTGTINFIGAGLLKYAGSAITINNLGSFVPGSGTFEYNGSTQTIASNTQLGAYKNLTLSGSGIKTTLNVSVNGVISMEGTATVSNPITAGSAASLVYKGSALQTIGPEFGDLTGVPLTRTFGGTGGVTINNPSGVNLGSNCAVTNTLTLTSGDFSVGNNSLTLYGPAIAGTGSNLKTTSSSTLNITSNSTGLYVPSSVTALNSFSVISTTGVTLNSTVVCNSVTLIGMIITGANILEAASITGAPGPCYYVYGNFRHTFSTSGGAFDFPVGDASNYAPVNISFSSVSVGGSLTVNTTDALHGNRATSGLKDATIATRYWSVVNSGIVFSTYAAHVYFTSGDVPGGANPSN